MRDFDRDFHRDADQMMRQRQRFCARMIMVIIAFWMLAAVAILYGVSHPEAIGSFFGRIAAGFRGAA